MVWEPIPSVWGSGGFDLDLGHLDLDLHLGHLDLDLDRPRSRLGFLPEARGGGRISDPTLLYLFLFLPEFLFPRPGISFLGGQRKCNGSWISAHSAPKGRRSYIGSDLALPLPLPPEIPVPAFPVFCFWWVAVEVIGSRVGDPGTHFDRDSTF